MDGISKEDWMDALVSAANELATTALGYDEGTVQSDAESCNLDMGSFIALAGDEESLQIGLSARREDAMTLCKSLLGMAPNEEDLGDEDLTDALGEIVNLLAGEVKIRMAHVAPSMQIGLPLVFRSAVETRKGIEVSAALIRWDPAQVRLLLLHHNRGG